jgi:serine/threonine-protein kinase/endoribonuclease IRE1
MAVGTPGWRAPEMLRRDDKLDELSGGDDSISSQGNQASTINGSSSGATRPRLTKSVDIFALGCLFHYILTEGKHPFGNRYHCEANIVKDKKDLSRLHSKEEEAYDLITRMIHPQPSRRPDIETCLLHPFFWDAEKRLGFLRKASDRFEVMCKGPPVDKRLKRLERDAESIVGRDWHQTLDPSLDQILLRDLRKSRTYDGRSVRDLLRVLRNKVSNFFLIPLHFV